jgi:hypothetical protein
MRLGLAVVAVAAVLGALAWTGADPAWAACTRLAFSVNDYGKDGPTKDAHKLLDKYIADWTKSKGIKTHTVSKRDVSCELFLNFVVFDEHTCKASALVCWGGAPTSAGAPPPDAKAK